MANQHGREALRGVEEAIFDLIAEDLLPEEWAGMLKVPLERAAARGNRSLAQRLVEAGADIGGALHESAMGGHGDIVSDLLENGTSIETRDAYRNTPLHVAASEGQTEMVQLLLRKGADIDTPTNDDGLTPLLAAVFHQRTAAALALLAAGADVSHQDGMWINRSVAHMAADRRGDVNILRAAIERGVDVHDIDDFENTPLHLAASSINSEAIDILMEAGASIDAKDELDSTPLHHAVRRLSPVNVTTLLKHGADVNARASHDETPLHYAARLAGVQLSTEIDRRRAGEVVDLLLRSGADETIVDDQGRKPADVVGVGVVGDNRLALDVEHVRKLLANAPADRAWRRRGYLMLCRAHPDRLQLGQDSGSAHDGTCQTASGGAGLERTVVGGDCHKVAVAAAECAGGDCAAGVVRKVLLLQEEGVFRTVVGYL